MSQLAQGFIEVTGYVAAVEAADTMIKAANVKVARVHKVDGPRVCVICEGDVAACQAAVDAAYGVCAPKGTVIGTNIIARPADGGQETYAFLDSINAQKAAKKKAKMEARAAAHAAAKSEPKAAPKAKKDK